MRPRVSDAATPWAGLIGGVLGLALAHQLGTDITFDHCEIGSPWIVILAVLFGLALATGGAIISLRTARHSDEGPARKLIAWVSVGAAALFSLMLILSLISSLVIPPCFA